MSNKNPFELRAEILQLAKEYMDAQHKMNVEYSQKLFEKNMIQIEELTKAYSMYSIDDLMQKAKEMYKFVNSYKD